jgi:hypothetical protein
MLRRRKMGVKKLMGLAREVDAVSVLTYERVFRASSSYVAAIGMSV